MSVCVRPSVRKITDKRVDMSTKLGRHVQLRVTLYIDVPVSTILGTLGALEALCDYALYKSTFTLHLHYI